VKRRNPPVPQTKPVLAPWMVERVVEHIPAAGIHRALLARSVRPLGIGDEQLGAALSRLLRGGRVRYENTLWRPACS
jgi:hypothetical protein